MKRNYKGEQIRSLGSKTRRWEANGIAYLSTRFRQDPSYTIRAEMDGTPVETTIASTDGQSASLILPGRVSTNWLLKDYTGADESLKSARGELVHVYGSKPPETDTAEIADPYADILFLDGLAEIAVGQEEAVRFELGKVLGLDVITQDRSITVWQPA